MAVSEAEIEALALGAMRAWVAGDEKAMKKLTKRDFRCMVGTRPPQLLDRPSSLAAMTEGFACRSFTFARCWCARTAIRHGSSLRPN